MLADGCHMHACLLPSNAQASPTKRQLEQRVKELEKALEKADWQQYDAESRADVAEMRADNLGFYLAGSRRDVAHLQQIITRSDEQARQYEAIIQQLLQERAEAQALAWQLQALRNAAARQR